MGGGMAIQNLCSVLSSLQSARYAGTLLSAPGVHPLTQPAIFLRETIPADVSPLLGAAQSGNFRTLNFPSTHEGLERKIQSSQDSFRGVVADPDEREFMFTVLAKGDQRVSLPVGTSTLYAKHGTPAKPHHAYHIVRSTRLRSSGVVDDDSVLILTQNHDGPSEVGALVVHDVISGKKDKTHVEILAEGMRHTIDRTRRYGLAASWIRFFWAAMPDQRAYFKDRTCLTEILPPLTHLPDGGRTNAFYEALAKKYFNDRPYDEMDLVTQDDRSLISARLPALIKFSDLSTEAQGILGQSRPESRPALRLLEKLGFRHTDRVDPLDGGPHLEGSFANNPIFTGARDFSFGGTTGGDVDEIGWRYGFIGSFSESRDATFLAALAPFLVVDNDLFTTHDVTEGLQLGIEDRVTVSVL